MPHPDDKFYTVPEGVSCHVHQYPGQRPKCYRAGDIIRMTADQYAACMPLETEIKSKSKGHPRFCTTKGAFQSVPTNTYTIPPGEWVCIDIAEDFDGECPPEILFVNWCSGCLRTSVDVLLEADALLSTDLLNGATMNEQLHYVGENSETCETPENFYIYNTNATPMTVNVAPHSA